MNIRRYGLPMWFVLIVIIFLFSTQLSKADKQTIAVWLFDEHGSLYPSAVIHDVGPNEYLMVLGRGGKIVEGKFGNALKVIEPAALDLPEGDFPARFGLTEMPVPEGRTVEPMTWSNAYFSALMTSGENHLRKEMGFVDPTKTKLNLGNFDWTVEFWLSTIERTEKDGVIFEIGQGPRGENDKVTRLLVNSDLNGFMFINQPGDVELTIPTDGEALGNISGVWNHYAFVYSSGEEQLRHYVNGQLQTPPARAGIRSLDEGEEDYFTLGRDGLWGRPLPGIIDELRFSSGRVYTEAFQPPKSFADYYLGEFPEKELKKGKPLLFTDERLHEPIIDLGNRKHLFIDDALLDKMENISFRVNPPRVDRKVMKIEGTDEGIIGEHQSFRKHITIVEDEKGLIRLYTSVDDDYLAVWISEDGENFSAPETGIEHKGNKNIVIPENVGTGTVLIDPNAPPEKRWKYLSDFHRRGVYVYTSPDGWSFKRYKLAVAPFRSGSQMDLYYDDQRQLYVGFHRTDFFRTPTGRTLRTFVMTEKEHLMKPWPYQPAAKEDYERMGKYMILHDVIPWFIDNGPLTPGGWGVEYPVVFAPDYDMDPMATAGIYNPKAIKYPWAPDTYLAFPVFYLYYYDGYPGSQVLSMRYGGGPTETQFAASRDGVQWKRYPRPTYVGLGRYDELDMVQTFIAQGMVKRGDEIWQYVFYDSDYHTSALERTRKRRLYRLIQRLDGFVSVDAPYDTYGTIITRPLRFEGNRLVLNIDTDAHGYALVGLLDEDGNPIKGFSIEESVMINGDHISIDAEWIKSGIERFGKSIRDFQGSVEDVTLSSDISSLAGKTVRVKIKLRGAKLYSMQFIDK